MMLSDMLMLFFYNRAPLFLFFCSFVYVRSRLYPPSTLPALGFAEMPKFAKRTLVILHTENSQQDRQSPPSQRRGQADLYRFLHTQPINSLRRVGCPSLLMDGSFLPTQHPSKPPLALWTIHLYLSCFKISVKKSSKLSVMYPSRSSSYFLNTSVMRFKLIHACTNKSKLSTPSLRLSYVRNSKSTNPSDRRYRNATSAFWNSSRWIVPERSVSKRSKSVRHEARKDHRPQNSSKPMEPDRSLSNMRIIIRTVCGSKAVQSPLTRAAESSFSESCPVSIKRAKKEEGDVSQPFCVDTL